jgi:PEGA domain
LIELEPCVGLPVDWTATLSFSDGSQDRVVGRTSVASIAVATPSWPVKLCEIVGTTDRGVRFRRVFSSDGDLLRRGVDQLGAVEGPVSGTVRTHEGMLLANVTVDVEGRDDLGDLHTESSGSGDWALPWLFRGGTALATARTSGLMGQEAYVIWAGKTPMEDLDFTLVASRRLTIVIESDQAGCAGLQDVSVRWRVVRQDRRRSSQPWRRADLRPSGLNGFELDLPQGLGCELEVRRGSAVLKTVDVPPQQRGPVMLSVPCTAELVVSLRGSWQADGGLTCTLRLPGRQKETARLVEGAFRFPHVEPGREYWLGVAQDGHLVHLEGPLPSLAPAEERHLPLNIEDEAVGVLELEWDPAGFPGELTLVVEGPRDLSPNGSDSWAMSAEWLLGLRSHRLNASGGSHGVPLRVGLEYSLQFRPPQGSGFGLLEFRHVGTRYERRRVELDVLPLSTIGIRVVDAQHGAPVPKTGVRIRPSGTKVLINGRLAGEVTVFSATPIGQASVTVHAPGYEPLDATVEVVEGGSEIELRMTRLLDRIEVVWPSGGSSFICYVTEPDGTPVNDLGPEAVTQAPSGAGGGAVLSGVPRRLLVLVVQPYGVSGGESVRRRVDFSQYDSDARIVIE